MTHPSQLSHILHRVVCPHRAREDHQPPQARGHPRLRHRLRHQEDQQQHRPQDLCGVPVPAHHRQRCHREVSRGWL